MTSTLPRRLFGDPFRPAVRAANSAAGIAAHLPARPKSANVVVGAGKGAAQMAWALEDLSDGPSVARS
jgi:glycerate 2-kinase